MSERDPFEHLRDLIDEPVEPRTAFAAELRARLMSDMSASEHSREEHRTAMEGTIKLRPMPGVPTERVRRIRPMAFLELAAVALVVLGLAAALSNGWFGNDPETPTSVPAAALQGDGTPTPAEQPEQTPTPAPNTMEPTVEPPGNIPGTIWTLALPDGESVDFGGMLVEDDVVYRLLATPSFVGIQAVDGETGTVKWQQAHRWAGNLFAIEDDTLYLDGGSNTLTAVDTETGQERWRATVAGNPIALDEEDDRIFVLLDSDMVTALNEETGEELWVAQGTVPQNPTGGSTSIPAIGKIAVADGVVAAVSTYGVLSGFDANTGEELWSHDGYDSASVAIETEDDRFIVTSGVGLPSMSARVESDDESGTSEADDDSVTVSLPASSGDCAGYFVSTTESGATEGGATESGSRGTPEAGASVSNIAGTTFRAQAIDPATGDIVWGQQAISGAVAATAAVADAANPVMCAIDVTTGQVSVDSSGSTVLAIGSVSSAPMAPVQVLEDDDATFVTIGTIEGVDQAPIAVAVDDGAVYLQLADGTLVKVASSQTASDDDEHDADHDDDSDDTPESDDD